MDGWECYKKVNISAGVGAGTNYQLIFKVYYGSGTDGTEVVNGFTYGKVYCNSKCQTDFDDIRFSNNDDPDTAYTQFRSSKVDGDYAIFVVKVTENLDAAQTLRIWYNNSVAEDVSSYDTFIDKITGVVLGLPMNEGSGDTCVDYSGNGNDADLFNTPVWGGGQFSGGLQFDGINQYGNIPYHESLNNFEEFTISFWMYPTIGVDGNSRIIINKGWADVGSFLLFTLNNEPFRMYFYIKTSGASPLVTYNIPAINTWYFVVLTFKRNDKLHMYVNNVESGTGAVVADEMLGLEQPIKIADSTTDYAGRLESFTFFDKVVEDSEHGNIYNNYGDVTLEAGSCLVRKWATTTLPLIDSWEGEICVIHGDLNSYADNKTDSIIAANIETNIDGLLINELMSISIIHKNGFYKTFVIHEV